ncbi:MAG: TetR/AcrR family transcriptional regulator [Rhodoblastus sp.]
MNEMICPTDSTDLAALSPRERLVLAATRLFCAHGISATGVDAVLREAGVAKMTLYKIFGSKDRLVEAVLEEEGQRWRDWFLPALLDGPQAPREKLDRIFPLLKEWFERDDFYGCPFINAVGEHDKSDARMRDLALRHKAEVLNAIASLAQAAGAGDPELLSHQIGLLMDGAIVAAMVTRQPALADVAARAGGAVLDAALAQVVVTTRNRQEEVGGRA